MLFYEPKLLKYSIRQFRMLTEQSFSALLRAEIVETEHLFGAGRLSAVSVLFYEPKLLKFGTAEERSH